MVKQWRKTRKDLLWNSKLLTKLLFLVKSDYRYRIAVRVVAALIVKSLNSGSFLKVCCLSQLLTSLPAALGEESTTDLHCCSGIPVVLSEAEVVSNMIGHLKGLPSAPHLIMLCGAQNKPVRLQAEPSGPQITKIRSHSSFRKLLFLLHSLTSSIRLQMHRHTIPKKLTATGKKNIERVCYQALVQVSDWLKENCLAISSLG